MLIADFWILFLHLSHGTWRIEIKLFWPNFVGELWLNMRLCLPWPCIVSNLITFSTSNKLILSRNLVWIPRFINNSLTLNFFGLLMIGGQKAVTTHSWSPGMGLMIASYVLRQVSFWVKLKDIFLWVLSTHLNGSHCKLRKNASQIPHPTWTTPCSHI